VSFLFVHEDREYLLAPLEAFVMLGFQQNQLAALAVADQEAVLGVAAQLYRLNVENLGNGRAGVDLAGGKAQPGVGPVDIGQLGQLLRAAAVVKGFDVMEHIVGNQRLTGAHLGQFGHRIDHPRPAVLGQHRGGGHCVAAAAVGLHQRNDFVHGSALLALGLRLRLGQAGNQQQARQTKANAGADGAKSAERGRGLHGRIGRRF
jgi:hypothetical protein